MVLQEHAGNGPEAHGKEGWAARTRFSEGRMVELRYQQSNIGPGEGRRASFRKRLESREQVGGKMRLGDN